MYRLVLRAAVRSARAMSSSPAGHAPAAKPSVPPKPFSEMPNVSSWTMLLDGIRGRFNVRKPIEGWVRRQKELGPIYKMNMLGKVAVVTADVHEYEKVFRAAVTKYPPPLNIAPLLKYTEDRKKAEPGWSPYYHLSEGEHWRTSRTLLDEKLLHPAEVDKYLPGVSGIAEEMIARMHEKLTPEGRIAGLIDLLYAFSVEQIGFVVFGYGMGGLSKEQRPEVKSMLADLHAVFRTTAKLALSLPFYNLIETPTYKELKAKIDKPHGPVFAKLADEYYAAHPELERHDLLHHLRTRGGLTEEQCVQNMMTQIQAGSDTTTHSLHWLIYNLGRFPQVQAKLRESVSSVVPKGEKLTVEKLKGLRYLKAVVKESMRLTPTLTGIVRTLTEPIVVNGYDIPANTDIILMLVVSNRDPNVFERPDELLPERWMGEGRVNAFFTMPFGFGPRMCQGFRVAELEMYCLLAQLVTNFSWEHEGPPTETVCELTFQPEKPLNLKWTTL